MIKKILLLLLIVLSIMFLLNGLSAFCLENTIKIGTVSPRTGKSAEVGKWCDEGTFLATEEINSSGGILGMNVELVTGDDKAIPVEAVNEVRRLIYQDKVVAIVGSFQSPCTLAAMEISREAKIPQLCMSLALAVTQQGNPYIFRLQPTDGVIMKYLADFTIDELKSDKIGMIYEAGEWGSGAAKIALPRLEERGVPAIFSEKTATGDKDFSSQILKAKAAGVEVLILVVYEMESGLIAKQARQLGLDARIIGASPIGSPKYVEVGGINATEGSITITAFLPQDNRFTKKFEAKYNYTPDNHTAGVYDAIYILKHAIEEAKSTDPEKINEALHNIKNLEMVSGFFTYDEKGDGLTKVAAGVIKDGQVVPYY